MTNFSSRFTSREEILATEVSSFSASTDIAGVAPGTALSTTPPLALWNPSGSKTILIIRRVRLGYVSGTLGAGSLVYAFVPNQTVVPSGGSELATRALDLSSKVSTARAFQGATLAAAPTFIMPSMIIPTTPPPGPIIDDIDGDLSVGPGMVFIVQGVGAAGIAPLIMLNLMWNEAGQ